MKERPPLRGGTLSHENPTIYAGDDAVNVYSF